MKLLRQNSDVLFVIILCLIPLIFWYLFSYSAISFANLSNTSQSFGQISSIVGGVLFCLDFILAARFNKIENIFRGLNRVYIWHHYLGAISFILLLLHPLLLGSQYLSISLKIAFNFFFPPLTNYGIWFGIIALSIVIALLFITFYVNLHYETWKLTHEFLGVALSFAFFHMLFANGSLSTNKPLHYYLLTLGVIACYSFVYRTVLARIMVKKYIYVVEDVLPKGQDTIEIQMLPVTEKMKYEAGQFIFIDVKSLGISHEEHPFSITSDPYHNTLSVGVKSLGDYTETIKLIKKGSEIKVEGPFGRFLYMQAPNPKQVWVAGGIGITPFMSMAKSLPNDGRYYVDLFYVVSTKDEASYLNDLLLIIGNNKYLKVYPVYTKEQGRLNAEKLIATIPDLKDRDIFLCGPPPMMKSLKTGLHKIGVKKRKVHSEEFKLL